MATTETRYFKNASVTWNGLTCYSLAIDQTGTSKTLSHAITGAYFASNVGIRVWKRDSGGTETEITGGTPVAVILCWDGDYHTVYSSTYTPTATALNSTDSIVVRVYVQWGASGSWNLIASAIFTTEQIGASQLDAVEWTVYYYISYSVLVGKKIIGSTPEHDDTIDVSPLATSRSSIYFHFDGADNSRITNFTWSTAVTAVTYQGDGLTFISNYRR